MGVATDAHPLPKKNQAFRVYFALRLNTGGLNSGAAGLDSEISKDGGAVVDCINEATEMGTSGIYYLDLWAAEMNCNCAAISVKSSTAGAITKDIILYPQGSTDIIANLQSINDSLTAANALQRLVDFASVSLTVDDTTFPPTTTEFETTAVVTRADDHFKGRACIFTSGTLIGQATRVVGSTTSNGKIKLTVTPLTAAPPGGILFILV